MPKSFREIAASLASADGMAVPKEKPVVKKRKRPSPAEIEEMLLRFLKGDEEGSASRLAAAKSLLERLSAAPGENDDAKKRERDERAEAETEAQAILAELSAAKLASLSFSSAVGADGSALAIDAAGTNGS